MAIYCPQGSGTLRKQLLIGYLTKLLIIKPHLHSEFSDFQNLSVFSNFSA